MSTRKGGLGRGLGALIPSDVPSTGEGTSLREIPTGQIEPNQFQPREHFDEESLASLTASVRALGVLQPVLVRPTDDPTRFELIAGERRWRAAKRAGLSSVPAIVRPVDDLDSLEQAVVENLHRQDLNPLEEAAAYQQLMEDFNLTQERLAERVGKSRSAVANTLRLFQLPPSIQKMVAENQLTAGHARALLGTPDRAFQEGLARKAVSAGLSVREVEDAVRRREGGGADDEAAPPEKNGATALRPAGLLELEELLARHLDTRVAVSMGARKGRVVIDFATLEDLERIYRAMVHGRPSDEDETLK